MRYMPLALTLFGLGSLQSFAWAGPCDNPQNSRDVVACARERHPEVRSSKLTLEQARDQVGVAGVIQNPELDSKFVAGKALGDQITEVEVSLMQPIELGGKRGSRVKEAEAKSSQTAHESSLIEAKVAREMVIRLHRIRQIRAEKGAIQESLSTYEKLISQYQNRPRLAPEQEVSLSVFRISRADYMAKGTVTDEEERELLRDVRIATGLDISAKPALLPAPPSQWPAILAEGPEGQSSRARVAEAAVQTSLGALERAQSESWPDLKIGPVAQWNQSGPSRESLYGGAISFALPFWNTNGPARSAASKGLALAELQHEITTQEVVARRAENYVAYRAAVKALSDGISLAELQKRHARMESLSFQGLISGALVIEAHRQMVDFQKTRHELELRAIEALLSIYESDGQVNDIVEATFGVKP